MKEFITAFAIVIVFGMIGFALFTAGVFGTKNVDSTELEYQQADGPTPTEKISTLAEFEKIVNESEVPVLFDFYADWCGPCNIQAEILSEMRIPTECARIVKIDVDVATDLAAKMEARSIPLLVVYKDGKQTYRESGLASEDKIAEILDLK